MLLKCFLQGLHAGIFIYAFTAELESIQRVTKLHHGQTTFGDTAHPTSPCCVHANHHVFLLAFSELAREGRLPNQSESPLGLPPVPVFVDGCSGQLEYRQQLYKACPPQWLHRGCPSPAPHIICEESILSLEQEAGQEGPPASLVPLISIDCAERGRHS